MVEEEVEAGLWLWVEPRCCRISNRACSSSEVNWILTAVQDTERVWLCIELKSCINQKNYFGNPKCCALCGASHLLNE